VKRLKQEKKKKGKKVGQDLFLSMGNWLILPPMWSRWNQLKRKVVLEKVTTVMKDYEGLEVGTMH